MSDLIEQIKDTPVEVKYVSSDKESLYFIYENLKVPIMNKLLNQRGIRGYTYLTYEKKVEILVESHTWKV